MLCLLLTAHRRSSASMGRRVGTAFSAVEDRGLRGRDNRQFYSAVSGLLENGRTSRRSESYHTMSSTATSSSLDRCSRLLNRRKTPVHNFCLKRAAAHYRPQSRIFRCSIRFGSCVASAVTQITTRPRCSSSLLQTTLLAKPGLRQDIIASVSEG